MAVYLNSCIAIYIVIHYFLSIFIPFSNVNFSNHLQISKELKKSTQKKSSKGNAAQLTKKYLAFIKTEGSLLCSEQPASTHVVQK